MPFPVAAVCGPVLWLTRLLPGSRRLEWLRDCGMVSGVSGPAPDRGWEWEVAGSSWRSHRIAWSRAHTEPTTLISPWTAELHTKGRLDGRQMKIMKNRLKLWKILAQRVSKSPKLDVRDCGSSWRVPLAVGRLWKRSTELECAGVSVVNPWHLGPGQPVYTI